MGDCGRGGGSESDAKPAKRFELAKKVLMMKTSAAVLATLISILPAFGIGFAGQAATRADRGLAAAIADPERGDVREVDARRKPLAVLSFSGVKRGDKVVDLIPGQGYFSKTF